MIDDIERGRLRTRRLLMAAVALWATIGLTGAASGTQFTLQEMFDGQTFTQNGLAFSGFDPVLANNLPSGQALENLIKTNPMALFDIQFLDFATGKFSHSWGNAQDAVAGNIGLEILPDKGSTPGVDPGFRLNGAVEWTADAGWSTPGTNDDIASAQLSAFAYTVTATTPQLISSAEISQSSTIDAVGPDVLSMMPFAWPDVAAGFALQFILYPPNSTDISNAILNYTLEAGIQSSGGVVPISVPDAWSGFDGKDAIRVVSVIGVGASSEGGFTMNTLEQRIDPPPPGQAPLPGTLLLVGIGLAGMTCRRRLTV